MKFTDLFIKRPVLATVISLLILLFGLRAMIEMELREYPKLDNTVITVTTVYPGASADLIQGFITSPLQQSIASADGVDYMTATSTQGISAITAHIKLNFDPEKAFTNVMSKVSEARANLPQEAEDPVIEKKTGARTALMYLSFYSPRMSPQQITDYVTRVVQPKLETVPGVAEASILGPKIFAMRIWLNPQRMAAFHVTPNEVAAAIQRNNFQSAAGDTKGELIAFTIDAKTTLTTADEFKNLVVKSENSTLIRLKDVAKVELGAEDYNVSVTFNAKQAIAISISPLPSANPLTVISDVRKLLPSIQKELPPNLTAQVVYDATKFIRSSIKEVIKTILEATAIVMLIIFLFLGSFRSVIIPVITIPLSLIGVCSLMLWLGYSINLLTLLAMVLAIGMVVDDAIVVVENIHRHIEEGLAPFKAALQGAREIALPIIAMTLTLAAVYAPIGFMGGVTGALFKEFAFTLACAVIISGIIALTLSPMMCSKVLSSSGNESRFAHYLDERFERLKAWYQRRIHSVLNYRSVTVVFAMTVLSSCAYMYMTTAKELAPHEDRGFLFVITEGPKYANIDYTQKIHSSIQ